MNKLNVFVCENFAPDFVNVLSKRGSEDVKLNIYPTMCESKVRKNESTTAIEKMINGKKQGLFICGNNCEVLKLLPEEGDFEAVSGDYCYNHLANKKFIDYIIRRGGCVIGLGWLNNWREHIETMGFDQETARRFYKEYYKELVFFDTGTDEQAENKLEELAMYLDLPFVVIPSELDAIEFALKSAMYKWRLQKNKQEYTKSIREAQSQCAEYSALLDVIGKISSDTNKREAIEKIKNIFLGLFGAQEFRYHDVDSFDDTLPEETRKLFLDSNNEFMMTEDKEYFFVIIKQKERIHGLIEAGRFVFPQYIEKYLNFAVEIGKVSGLVLSNIEQYEKIMKSEQEFKYLSSHDALTGLYNRNFINEIVGLKKDFKDVGIVSFDMDKLKLVNDNYGHLEGDKLILGFAAILKKCFRESDTVARIGGDEFVAIIPNCDRQMQKNHENRIHETVKLFNEEIKEEHLKVSVSFGIAIGESPEDTYELLLGRADELMYADKMRKNNP